MKSLCTLLCLIYCFGISAQTPGTKKYILTEKKSNNVSGLLLSKPVNSSGFKFDSSQYKIFYVCEISLSSRNSVDGIKLHYLIGQKKTGELSVTVDTNFNNNFLDDNAILIPRVCKDCDAIDSTNMIKLNLTRLNKAYFKDLQLRIIPRCCFKGLIRKSNHPFLDTLDVAFDSPFEHLTALTVAGKEYVVSANNVFPRIDYNRDPQNIEIHVKSSIDSSDDVYSVSDTINIGTDYFAIKRLSKYADTIVLNKLSRSSITGYQSGFYLYDFHEKDVLSNEDINLSDYKGRYLLLEFWGTWCNPCVALHDDIIQLLKTHPKINYLGVALDKNAELIKKYISNSPELKKQIFVNMDNSKSTSIINKLRVNDYPTFILIDKKTKIIFRNDGVNGFKELSKYLAK